MRILIADDEPVFLKLLSSFFSKLDFLPIPCADGEQAWAVLDSPSPPRLAILDWEMPGRSGIDLVRALKAKEQVRPTYCILLTAHTESSDIATALSAGAHDYVRKPMHHEEMRSRIRLWRRLIEAETTIDAWRGWAVETGPLMASSADPRWAGAVDRIDELLMRR